jgi:hypothetical protein
MNTQQRMHYILHNDEYIRRYMAQHDVEVRARRPGLIKGLLKWLQK